MVHARAAPPARPIDPLQPSALSPMAQAKRSKPKAGAAPLEVVAIKATQRPAPAPAEPEPAAPPPAVPAEAEPEQAPGSAAAEPEAGAAPAKKKGKGKGKKPYRPPIPLPSDADELTSLGLGALDRVCWEVGFRLGKAYRRRAQVLTAAQVDESALVLVNAEIGQLGLMLNATNSRRAQLRAQSRRAVGREPELSEAIAIAAGRVLNGPLYRKVVEEAKKIIKRCEADLAGADGEASPAPAHDPAEVPAALEDSAALEDPGEAVD